MNRIATGCSSHVTRSVLEAWPQLMFPWSGPSGTVVFKDRGVVIATVAVTMGRARISIASLSRGTHVITATYQGDSSFLASLTKTALTQKIT